nr:MAG TPA: hypothetical protein [Caudoviricetes sp.]
MNKPRKIRKLLFYVLSAIGFKLAELKLHK